MDCPQYPCLDDHQVVVGTSHVVGTVEVERCPLGKVVQKDLQESEEAHFCSWLSWRWMVVEVGLLGGSKSRKTMSYDHPQDQDCACNRLCHLEQLLLRRLIQYSARSRTWQTMPDHQQLVDIWYQGSCGRKHRRLQ